MTRGRTQAAAMLARLGLRQDEIANRCGVARSTVGHWITGFAKPRDDYRLILRDAYRIPLDAWTTPFRADQPSVDC